AKHETGHTFEPVTEIGTISYFNRKYDPFLANTPERRKRAVDMENTKKGDGYKYRGRGYVQLTWKKNYRKSGNYLKKDLINNPELALDQKDATKIMIYGMETGMFTGKKMSDYISVNNVDYLNARRIINGMDHASAIAGYAYKLEDCLRWL
ncbi:glycoside hydrolase, family 19, partial [Aggregatibacter actinomycetemcomitans]|uniref:glycoside hydrolase family 19 protein n=1 Tax=Aggregatibacter actinomycetemcomitans TaxID=714 RepID=UPI002402C69A